MCKLYKYMDPAFIHRQYIIKNLMINNNVLILTSGTGLGKTTKVPLFMIELFTKKGLLGGYTIEYKPGSPGLKSNNSTYDNFGMRPYPDPSFNTYDFESKSYSLPYIDEKSRVLCAVPKNILVEENAKRDSFINQSIRNTDGPNETPIISGITTNNPNKTYGEALTFLTSGYLNQLMISDPYLTNVSGYNISCVIVDEAHERSLDIDILLVNLKNILLIRPNFKVVIMSATINTDLFTKYFFNAPLYHVNPIIPIGERPQVVINYLKNPCYNYIFAILQTLSQILSRDNLNANQHILIFVSGNPDKKLLFEEFGIDPNTNKGNTNLGQINLGVQYVDSKYTGSFKEKDFPRSTIFIATNVIESSVTISNLKYVIDTGLALNSSYDSKLDMSSLNINAITTPSADQRKGRVGRTMPGICYRLYTKRYFETIMKGETVPEIFKENIESIFIKILNKKQNFLNFDFIQCPSKEQCFYTMQKLIKYGIIPDDYNICSTYDDLSNNNKQNITLYSKLSYIKVDRDKPLIIDNILLHIIIDYYYNNGLDNVFKDIVKVLIVSSLYLNQQIKINEKWNPYNDISEIFFIYNQVFSQPNTDSIINYFNAFVGEFVSFFGIDERVEMGMEIDENNNSLVIDQINKILSIHGHKCRIGSIEFNDNSNDSPKTYYFGSRNIDYKQVRDYDTEYTYIKGKIMNNNIQLSLLTPLSIPIKGGDSGINSDEYNSYVYEGGYGEDKHEDEYDYEDKYTIF